MSTQRYRAAHMRIDRVGSSVSLSLPDGCSVSGLKATPLEADSSSPNLRTRSSGDLLVELEVHRVWTDADLQQVDAFEISSGPGPMRSSFDAPDQPTASVDVDHDETAAILLERDGVFQWVLPEIEEHPQRRAVFALAPRVGEMTRGIGEDWLFDRIKTFVFKIVIRKATSWYERGIVDGLVHVANEDTQRWKPIAKLSDAVVPTASRARVLLLVHGTFSSATGSFGSLAATPAGRAFLVAARTQYDAIVGFEHKTLSVDPAENAGRLAELLGAHGFAARSEIDVVTVSRGCLVARHLIERQVAGTSLAPLFRSVTFVCPPNGGTLLADPEQWREKVNLLTTLVAATTRLISVLVPPAALVGQVAGQLGGVVKALAASVLEQQAMPGLAAMDPRGDFLQALNGSPLPQHADTAPVYRTVTSHFNVDAGDVDHAPEDSGLPKALLVRAADFAINRLFGRVPHDLVVPNDAAADVHPDVRNRLAGGCLAFPENPYLHHLGFFLQPAVTQWLAHGLGLGAEPASTELMSVRDLLDAR